MLLIFRLLPHSSNLDFLKEKNQIKKFSKIKNTPLTVGGKKWYNMRPFAPMGVR